VDHAHPEVESLPEPEERKAKRLAPVNDEESAEDI
jgi:hypothetical protein